MKKMRVAIIGQGRSGRDIHGRFFRSEANDFCEVVAIVEADAARRLRAKEEFGCDVVSDYTELFSRGDIDLVVNASYSQMHYPITKDLLAHGFNVLCEKPFGRTYEEGMDLILTARAHGVLVTGFHQTLYTSAFLNVKRVIESGKIGEVLQMNLKYSGFARRWDWQTLQCNCAGSLYNSGPHPVGQALALLGWDKETRVAFSSLKTALTSGDADDVGKVILETPHKPVVDIEVISADAFAGDYTFKIFGTKGTLLSTNSSYKLKYIEDFSVYPERPVERGFLSKEDGTPSYCAETLRFTEESGEFPKGDLEHAAALFYRQLYAAVIEGKALEVTPEQAAHVVSIIEACHAQNRLPVKFN